MGPLELHYHTYGAGSPLVILHGLFGSLNNWHSHAAFLGKHFQVFTVDQRNHGASPHAASMNYTVMADDLREFIGRHHLAPVHLLGHSMGGKTVMQFALSYPQEVRKLIVVDIRPQGDPPRHDAILDALWSVDLTAVRSREDVDAALAPAIVDPTVRQFLATNLKRQEDGIYTWKMDLDSITRNYGALIGPLTSGGRFTGPALFVSGGRSDFLTEADHPAILELFPNAEFVGIPTAGHWVHADAPDEFRRVVLEFLA